MKNFLPNFYYFITFLFISILLTPVSIYVGKKLKIVDKPHEKRGDKEKITPKLMPRSGGFSIYISLLILFIYLYIQNPSKQLLSILIGGTIIFIVGVIDDRFKLRAWIKLLFEIVASLIPIFYGVRVNFITNPGGGYLYLKELSIPFTILWITGITNAINIIDGLDGLASGIVSIVAITLGFVSILKGQFVVAAICFSISGIGLGFLIYNFPPAKIYLGDSGALLFGFLLAEIAVWGALKTTTSVILIVAIIALGFPIIETFSSIIRRVLRKKNIFEADMDHIHYKLMYSGMKEKEVIILLYFITILFSILSIILLKRLSLWLEF